AAPASPPEKAWDAAIPHLRAGRSRKPRADGLTMVIDRGLGLRATEDLLEFAGDYIDQIKLGFGTSVFLDERWLRRQIELIRRWDIDVYPGGSLFEAAVGADALAAYLRHARALGFTAVEISDGTIDLEPQTRAEAIRRARELG